MVVVHSQEKKSKIIINADDFGLTIGVNRAIAELVNAGTVTSVSVMTNMPHYREIRDLKKVDPDGFFSIRPRFWAG